MLFFGFIGFDEAVDLGLKVVDKMFNHLVVQPRYV